MLLSTYDTSNHQYCIALHFVFSCVALANLYNVKLCSAGFTQRTTKLWLRALRCKSPIFWGGGKGDQIDVSVSKVTVRVTYIVSNFLLLTKQLCYANYAPSNANFSKFLSKKVTCGKLVVHSPLYVLNTDVRASETLMDYGLAKFKSDTEFMLTKYKYSYIILTS